jgi:Ca2+-transporting ATPase
MGAPFAGHVSRADNPYSVGSLKEGEMKETPNPWWTRSSQDVLKDLGVSEDSGLTHGEAKKRQKQYGPNRLREVRAKSSWLILGAQFKSLMTGLLAGACVLSFIFGDWVEGLAIVAVLVINGTIGFITELRAVRSMEALVRLGRVSAKVRRGGRIQEILAEALVPGDIVTLEGGDMVSADLRLIRSSKLQADESTLTGESMPVSKTPDPLEVETSLADRMNMLFKGTAVTRGSCEGVVVETGMHTELGRIASLVEEAGEQKTPLEKQLDHLGQKLIWGTLAIVALIATTGIIAGKDVFLMIETAIALAVAAVPEGLPIVATIALARGMWRMTRRNALISRLSAVETLGATSVICTDKTGTLTENRLTVSRVVIESGEIALHEGGSSAENEDDGERGHPENPGLQKALEIGVLCNNAALPGEETGENKGIGDPLEVALLLAGAAAGIHQDQLIARMPEVREEAFDSDAKMMATFHKDGDRFWVAVKGAPESVLGVCSHIRTEIGDKEMGDEDRRRWLGYNEKMGKKGLRVLALAAKNVDSPDANAYDQLALYALMGLLDPPRRDVRQTIASCRDAGIRVIMVTGDQAETAKTVALAVGLIDGRGKTGVIHGRRLGNLDQLSQKDRQHLLEASIFARVNPEQKLDLIALHQTNKAIVAMTGDGVNDAPALKKADIGVAMGQRGTQVAREAADMILKDDAFSTIVAAIQQGRVIYNNIRRFVLYMLSCNISEIMTVSLAAFVNAPLPILPLQILFLNLVADVFPALALGVSEGDPTIMRQPPRDSSQPLLTRRHWLTIGGYSLVITLSVLAALALAITWFKMGERQAVTISFLTLAFAQLWHVFNMRESGSGFFRNEITQNPFIWGALALCVGLLLLAVYLPGALPLF